jgi:hypothetical protein
VSGTTITQPADAWVECVWTPGAGETLDLMVRRTDDDNCWIIRCSQAGSTIKVIQKEGGAETERGSTAAAFVAGTAYNVKAKMYGTVIAGIRHPVGTPGVSASYALAAFNQTATGVKVSGVTVAHLAAWPIYPTFPAV